MTDPATAFSGSDEQLAGVAPTVLIVSSVASMIHNFNLPNIELLLATGADVHVACNFRDGNTIPPDHVDRLRADLAARGVGLHQIDFSRRVAFVSRHARAFRQLDALAAELEPALMHCHSPIGGAITRLVARRRGVRVIYTAHGFHFSAGAPLSHWLTYYPVEWWLSRHTDVLVTVNDEDYQRARRLRAREVASSPGVGVDLSRFAVSPLTRQAARERLGLAPGDVCLLSVGELNRNKNHEVVIRALAALNAPRLRYLICGRGALHESLTEVAETLSVSHIVTLLGYQQDVERLYAAADIFVVPSRREGLPIALVEAMASGLPCIGSRVRGVTDLLGPHSPDLLVDPTDVQGFTEALRLLLEDEGRREQESGSNLRHAQNYSVDAAMRVIGVVYARQLNPS